ncbi:MAG: preprotein translocase subunit SecG [Elusimicrobiota bacterium]|jgi:preprotein translocase subunit SecG|nr:preprotein translocase subunit SecG [Elusimicrobiota bacterium]
MDTLILVLHFAACVFLIMLVLMQSGKGSAAGIFGASNSDSVFAGPTAATFITKLTAGVAVFIMITSVFLTVGVGKRGASSVVDRVGNIPAASAAPAVPAQSQPQE